MPTRAAAEVGWSYPKFWKIENGLQAVKPIDVRVLCSLYGASEETTEALAKLAQDTRNNGGSWWQTYLDGAIPRWFASYVGLEEAASRIRQYEAELVPGLLQTAGYTRSIFAVEQPTLTAEEREKGVQVKVARQRLLQRSLPPAPRLEVVINEAAFRRVIPDRDVMSEQLRHLMHVGQNGVGLRVLPFSAGPHRATVSGFSILDFPQRPKLGPEPTTVYSDHPTGAIYLHKEPEVEFYQSIWDDLILRSLSPRDSLIFISKINEETVQ